MGAAVALPRGFLLGIVSRVGREQGRGTMGSLPSSGLELCGKVGAPLAPGAVPITACSPVLLISHFSLFILAITRSQDHVPV